MIIAYFESGSHAELVGIFNDEDAFNACAPALKKLAGKHRMILTESMEEEAWPVNA